MSKLFSAPPPPPIPIPEPEEDKKRRPGGVGRAATVKTAILGGDSISQTSAPISTPTALLGGPTVAG